MQNTLLLLAVTGAVLLSFGLHNSFTTYDQDPKLTEAWQNWKMQYTKAYGATSDEAYRFQNFSQTYKRVKEHETKGFSFTIGLNRFADLTPQEFKAQYLSDMESIPKMPKNYAKKQVKLNSPDSIDWTDLGRVSGIKDQGQCGSCWAFSATGALEGLKTKNGGAMTTFSEQELVDCSYKVMPYYNMGCKGGLMDNAFDYVKDHGISTEADYPYTAQDGTCSLTPSMKKFNIGGRVGVATGVDNLMDAIASQGPVSVGIYAETIMSYTGGIYDDWNGCEGQMDHGVLAVGYGWEGAHGFIKVKNSWGYGWGESGYIRMAMRPYGEGICGIDKNASYPTA